MRRWTLFLIVAGLAGSAVAFDPTIHGNRIGVLDPAARYDSRDNEAVVMIERYLCDELRSRGFDAFPVGRSYEALTRFDPLNADYYVEIAGSDGATTPVGGVAVGTENIAVDLGIIVSRVATQIRLYDGRTLDLVRTFDLQKRSTSVVPTGIGVGGWSGRLFFSAAIPLFQWRQVRSAAHGVARDAASAVSEAVQR
jgi:hypothetical protein